MNLVVSYYQDWAKDQVMNLICREYGYNLKEYAPFYAKFYEDKFQKDAIKVIVIDEDNDNRVVGFFALFYWPYQLNGKVYNSLKGVNAIVMPEYRGNGIFKKILEFIDTNTKDLSIDFFIATPLPAAYYGFKKNGWTALLDLNWYLRINNYLSFCFPISDKKLASVLNEEKKANLNNHIDAYVNQIDTESFVNWRAQFYKTKKYYLSYIEGKNIVQFGVKLNVRKKIIRELIIGEVSTNNYDSVFLAEGLKYLLKEIKKIKSITIVSIAANPHNDIIMDVINKNRFSKIKNIIHIVVKDLNNCTEILDKEKWILYRADLDSW